MVKAEITIGTCYGDTIIPVEVLGKGPRPGTVWVQALNGLKPFTKNSHGCSCQDSKTVVLIPHLREIRVECNPEEKPPVEPNRQTDQSMQIRAAESLLPVDWFLESAYEDRTYSE